MTVTVVYNMRLRFVMSVCVSPSSAGPPDTAINTEGARAQPPANDHDSLDQQLKGPINGSGVGETQQEPPPLERGQGGQPQQASSATATASSAQERPVGGEAAGASASSTAGLVANGAADLLQASREEHVRCASTYYAVIGTLLDGTV